VRKEVRAVREYKKEIAYLLTIKPRRWVKTYLYSDKQRHDELGIEEKTLNKIWTSLMTKNNPEDQMPKKRKVVVYYKRSHKLRGVYPNERSVARSIGRSVETIQKCMRQRMRDAIFEFKEEMR
jgi:hypothetical protein